MQDFVERYDAEARGPAKYEVLADYLVERMKEMQAALHKAA